MDEPKDTSRRTFLQASAVLLAGSALGACDEAMPEPSAQQKSMKRTERSKVLIVEKSNYEDLDQVMLDAWKQVGPDVKGKSVFLKVNLVDFRGDLPVFTNPALVGAAIQALKAAGAAKIRVGDGPALSRDTEQIAKLTGLFDMCQKESVEFVDLNVDDLQKVVNPLNFTGVSEFLLPKSVMTADLLISTPKLKTHHWAMMTCSMKNMFGVVPGRKYGWPKNMLHVKGIDLSVVDLVSMLKPGFAIVDGIVAMEGDGPLNGKAKQMHVIVMGDDPVAVDTVCANCMQLPVHKISYLNLAGKVLGNNNLSQIDVIGSSIDSVKKKFLLPPNYEPDGKLKNITSAESGVT